MCECMKLTRRQQEYLCESGLIHPILCKMCTNHTKWQAGKGIYSTYCSKSCSRRDINFIRNKANETNLKKYGTKNAFQNAAVQEKQKQTNLERYGGHPINNSSIRDKIDATNVTRYGHANPRKSEAVKAKIKNTQYIKYGGHPQNNLVVREKRKQTSLTKYGTLHPSSNELVKLKQVNTMIEKYGVKSNKQSHMISVLPLLQDHTWLYDQYITKDKTAIQIAIELKISDTTLGRWIKKHNISIKSNTFASNKAVLWLINVERASAIKIQHAQNGGEFVIPSTKYRADGYCSETNTIYEFYGDYWHGNPILFNATDINNTNKQKMKHLYESTMKREDKIKSLGYNLITIWENEYDKGKI
jgi:hypothetical protein